MIVEAYSAKSPLASREHSSLFVFQLTEPELSKKKNRHASGCGPMVVAEHSAEALSALNRMMG
jgi:hypothetical protein